MPLRARAGTPAGGEQARIRPDRGAVAVLVSVLISTVLLTIGALAVDLGAAWAERAGLTTSAEGAALAGAAELPMDPAAAGINLDDAKDRASVAAVLALCSPGNIRPGWDTAQICPSDGRPVWASDGDLSNGEVRFVWSEEYAAGSEPLILQLIPPPVHVRFGLAGVMGVSGTDIRGGAAARRGLPFPADRPIPVAPYYVTLADLTAPGYEGICLRTTPRPAVSSWDPAPDPTTVSATDPTPLLGTGDVQSYGFWGWQPNSYVPRQTPVTRRLHGATLGPITGTVPVKAVTVYVGAADAAHTARTTKVTFDPGRDPGSFDDSYDIEFTTPDLSADPAYGGPVPVWFVVDDGVRGPWISPGTSVTYPDPPALPETDCDTVDAGRGLTDLARADGSQGAGQPTVDDVFSGLDTMVHPFGSWPGPQPLPGTDVDCYDLSLTGSSVEPSAPPATGQYVPEANCVRLEPGSGVRPEDLTTAWLGDGTAPNGRLHRLCSPQVETLSGIPGMLDATNPFWQSNGLLAPGVAETTLRDRIRAGYIPDDTFHGAILEEIFDCPRFLLVPVLDTSRPPAAADGSYPVVGLTYFWVYDVYRSTVPRAARGLIFDGGGDVVGIRGWAIDPGYVRGGDWVDHTEDASTALPYSAPAKAVLVRAPGDDHPDDTGP